jgi:hypothetical protein
MCKYLIVVIALMILSPRYASARHKDLRNPYWVTESNVNKPDVTFVKLYTADGHLFYEVKIEGKVIDIRKLRHKRMLNQILKKHKSRCAVSGKELKSVSSI